LHIMFSIAFCSLRLAPLNYFLFSVNLKFSAKKEGLGVNF